MNNQMPHKTSPNKSIKKLMLRIEKAGVKLKNAADSNSRKKAQKEVYDLKAMLAWQYLDENDFERADMIYDKLPQAAYGKDRYCGKARILIETQKYDEAIKLLNEALGKFPDYVPLLNTFGILHRKTGNHYEALRYLDRSLAIKNNPWSLYNKVMTLRSLEYFEEEHKLLLNLLEFDPEDPDYIAELAFCEAQRGNYQEVVTGCKKAIEKGYESPHVYTWLCKAYVNMDCMHESFAAAMEGIKKFPDQEAELYVFLGMGYMNLKQFEEAKTVLKTGLNLAPDSEVLSDLLELVEKMSKKRGKKKMIQKQA